MLFASVDFASVVLFSVLFASVDFASVVLFSVLFASVDFASVVLFSVLFASVDFASVVLFSVLFASVDFASVVLVSVVLASVVPVSVTDTSADLTPVSVVPAISSPDGRSTPTTQYPMIPTRTRITAPQMMKNTFFAHGLWPIINPFFYRYTDHHLNALLKTHTEVQGVLPV